MSFSHQYPDFGAIQAASPAVAVRVGIHTARVATRFASVGIRSAASTALSGQSFASQVEKGTLRAVITAVRVPFERRLAFNRFGGFAGSARKALGEVLVITLALVINVSGQVVMQQVAKDQGEFLLTSLPKGLYLLRIDQNNKRITKKIVVE